jgi:tol-pal system protein YbgF
MSSIALRTTDGLTKASRMSVHAIFSKQILSKPIRFICAAAVLAAAALSVPAQAQRLSLAERVTKLEQEQAGPQANIDLVNQINALQSQVQTLQGQIEELRHQVDETKSRNKEQYIDLDSRLARLEGRGGPAPAAAGAAAANNGQLQDITLGATPAPPPPPAAPPPGAAAPPRAPGGAPPPNWTPSAAPPAAVAADAAPAASAGDEKADYDQAFSALKDGRYAESARRFQAFIGQYPNSELTPNSYYWLGESYYVTQNYPISLDTFQKLLAQYPNSQKAPDALLKVGYCEYEMKKWDQAEATLNQVVQKYPDTTVARLAQGRLRALKLEARH